jgi:predicted helicase
MKNYIERILYRPFDVRYIYYNTNLIDTPSRPVSEMAFDGSNLILLSPLIKTTDDFSHALVSRYPAEKKSCSHDRATQMFPLLITDSGLFGDSAELNIPEKVKGKFLKNLTIPADNMHELGLCIISYCYSILYSPSYRRRYGKLLRNSFPKVPLDTNPILTEELIEIGKQLISLHLLEYKYEPSKNFNL